jgi:hypothetical protein
LAIGSAWTEDRFEQALPIYNMQHSPLRNSLPKIRQLVPKNYVNIKYILKPSPMSYRNSVLGSNLIKHYDSCSGLDSTLNYKKKVASSRARNEVSPVLLQLNVTSKEKQRNNKSYSVFRGKTLEKKQKSFEKKEKEAKMLDSVSYKLMQQVFNKFDLTKSIQASACAVLPNPRRPVLRNSILKRSLNPHASLDCSSTLLLQNSHSKSDFTSPPPKPA